VEADGERRLRSEREPADSHPLRVAEAACQQLVEDEGDVGGLVGDVLDQVRRRVLVVRVRERRRRHDVPRVDPARKEPRELARMAPEAVAEDDQRRGRARLRDVQGRG
jgi:hypothetical protein